MSQASKRKIPVAAASREQFRRRVREAGVIVLVSAALFITLALFTYHPSDPGWSQAVSTTGTRNAGGLVGAYVADILLYFLGYPGYLFPLALVFDGMRLFRARRAAPAASLFSFAFPGIVRFASFVLSFAGACALAALQFKSSPQLPALAGQLGNAGGVLGIALGAALHQAFGASGSALPALAMLLAGITLYTGLSWLWLMEALGWLVTRFFEKSMSYINIIRNVARSKHARKERRSITRKEQVRRKERPPPRIDPVVGRLEVSKRAEQERQKELFEPTPHDASLPPLDLLDAPRPLVDNYSRETLEAMSRQVELKLRDFNIQAEVVSVNPGPVITRFELQPAPGVKSSQISNLARDLARSLSVVSVRVVDVIPGKSVVGLEIPNASRETVCLGEILSSKEYGDKDSSPVLGLGKDISGRPVVMDLAKMPHLLVAGTTGSGKSVAINAMILSLLYKATPRETRLIMVDPKMLELSVYEGIPHLLTPVVTDMKEAANALRWCVAEMERRYRLMAALGVRQINGYNRKIKEAAARGEPLLDSGWTPGAEDEQAPELETLPFIVVIIDELADMMMTVGKKVEQLIARLAQKARASGIHLILATQRPSVDVITGLIKANIPCRIAFQVAGRVDSRTILDQMGAENLLGHGDMLFLPPGTSIPVRVHGAFVDDHEVHKVVSDVRSRGAPSYLDGIVKAPEEGGAPSPTGLDAGEDGGDALYEKAVRVVMEERKASISYIQRRLRIGYNRAARFMEQMESEGLVGPVEANGSREIRMAPAE